MLNLFSEKNLLKIIKPGLYLALLVPFLTIQKFMFPFITSKVFFFNILIEVIFACWLVLVIFHPAYRPKFTWILQSLTLFVGLLFVSSIFGADFSRSFWSTQERAIGLFSILHFFAFFLTLSVFTKEDWRRYLKFSVLASVIMSIFAILQLYNPNLVLKNSGLVVDRPGSFLGNSAFLASYLIFNIFLSFWFAFKGFIERNENRLINILFVSAGIFETAILIFLTETRGAMLGLFAGVISLLCYFSFKKSANAGVEGDYFKIIKKISAAVLVAIILFSAAFFATKNSQFWQKIPGLKRLADVSLKDNTTKTRLIAWNVALESFTEKPVLGWGLENFKYPFDKNYDPRLMRFGFGETYWDKPHNAVLEQMVAGGVLGLLAYLLIFFFSLRYLFKKNDGDSLGSVKPFLLAILAAYFVQNIFLFDTFGSYLMFFVILAFINFSYAPKTETSQSVSLSDRTAKIISVFTLLAIIVPVFINAKILYANNRQYWIANYYANEMQDKAIEAYHDARDHFNPYRDQVYSDFSSLTIDLYKQGKLKNEAVVLKEAVSAIDAAIGRNPKNYSYYLDMADAANSVYSFNPKQLLAVSESSIKKAFEFSPKRQQIYYTFSKLKLIQDKKDEAVALLKEAVDLDPLSGDPHFIYGLFLLETKDIKVGLAEIERAAELGRLPQVSDEYRILGNYYGDLGMYEKAIENYERAVVLNPDDADAGLKLGIVYYYAGQNDAAKFMISQVLEGLPEFKQSQGYKMIEPILKDLGL